MCEHFKLCHTDSNRPKNLILYKRCPYKNEHKKIIILLHFDAIGRLEYAYRQNQAALIYTMLSTRYLRYSGSFSLIMSQFIWLSQTGHFNFIL